jgi:hypothetical protein
MKSPLANLAALAILALFSQVPSLDPQSASHQSRPSRMITACRRETSGDGTRTAQAAERPITHGIAVADNRVPSEDLKFRRAGIMAGISKASGTVGVAGFWTKE